MNDLEMKYSRGINDLLKRSVAEKLKVHSCKDVPREEMFAKFEMKGMNAVMLRDMKQYCKLSQELLDSIGEEAIVKFPHLLNGVGTNMIKAIFMRGLQEIHAETMHNIMVGKAMEQGKIRMKNPCCGEGGDC
jgi:hypothetical protein